MPRITISEHESVTVEKDGCDACGPERIHLELLYDAECYRTQAASLTPYKARELIRALEQFAAR